MRHPKNRSSPATARARARHEQRRADERGPVVYLAIGEGGVPSMIVDVDDVTETGLHVQETVPEAALSALFARKGDALAMSARGEGRVDVTLTDEGSDIVRVRGDVSIEVVHPCVRCLEDVRFPFGLSLDLRAVPGRGDHGADGLDLASPGAESIGDEDAYSAVDDDEDFVTFEGGRIDLLQIAREQILLALPMHPTCDSEGAVSDGPCRFEALKAAANTHGLAIDPRFQGLVDWAKSRAPKDVQ